jgi:hypothetical protein
MPYPTIIVRQLTKSVKKYPNIPTLGPVHRFGSDLPELGGAERGGAGEVGRLFS